MSSVKDFLKRKDIVITPQRYLIEALGAMAQGLFASLLIGTIIKTLGQQTGLEVLLSKLASDLPACSGEVINTALDWLHDSNAVSRATLLMTLAERMENSHPQKQLLARAERILKREIQDCQTASDIPRSIALYLNCVDALYGENAENHIFKDILDWNTFEDATEPELQNYDYHRSRNAFILAQRQIQILEGMLVKWPESEKAKAWLNAWACRLKQIPEKL